MLIVNDCDDELMIPSGVSDVDVDVDVDVDDDVVVVILLAKSVMNVGNVCDCDASTAIIPPNPERIIHLFF